MAEIKLCGFVTPPQGGPCQEVFHARIKKRDWPGGGTVDVACLSVGLDTVEIWPLPEPIRDMIQRIKTEATPKV